MARDSMQPWLKDSDPADTWGTDDPPRALNDEKSWLRDSPIMASQTYASLEHNLETREAVLPGLHEVENTPLVEFDPRDLEFGLASY